jgi:hypothetical protein
MIGPLHDALSGVRVQNPIGRIVHHRCVNARGVAREFPEQRLIMRVFCPKAFRETRHARRAFRLERGLKVSRAS